MAEERPAFTRNDFERGDRVLLREGRTANARVYRFRFGGKDWTVKDFSCRSWWVRNLIAPFLFWREVRAVQLLSGVRGVPNCAFRIDRDAVAIEFLPGISLSKAPKSAFTVQFLEKMESLMNRVHEAGIVHLDARGTGNWVILPNGDPGLIDFQAGICTRGLPAGIRKLLEDVDMSGVLKKWKEFHPDEMGEERIRSWERGDRLRRLWLIRGYFGRKKGKKRREQGK